jgi:hypothetical protein
VVAENVRVRFLSRFGKSSTSLFVNLLDEAFLFQLDDEPVIRDILQLDAAGGFARKCERVVDLDLHALPVHQWYAFEKYGDIVVGAFQIGLIILPRILGEDRFALFLASLKRKIAADRS